MVEANPAPKPKDEVISVCSHDSDASPKKSPKNSPFMVVSPKAKGHFPPSLATMFTRPTEEKNYFELLLPFAEKPEGSVTPAQNTIKGDLNFLVLCAPPDATVLMKVKCLNGVIVP